MQDTNYFIPHVENGVFSHRQVWRRDLKHPQVQGDLDLAKTEDWEIYCGCVEEPDKRQLLSIIGENSFHLSRVSRDSSLHAFGCFHHKPSAAQMKVRGYYQEVINSKEDGVYRLDLGGLLLPGVASLETAPKYGNGESSGKEPALRSSMGCFGLLCAIADFASLNASNYWRNEDDLWASIVFAATQLKPVGCNEDILQLMLLPGRKIADQYDINKVRLQDAHKKRRSILVIDLLRNPENFSKADNDTFTRNGPFQVPVRIPTAVFKRAQVRHGFASKQLRTGQRVLSLGRAHIKATPATQESGGNITYTAYVDRLALLAVDDHFTCIPNARVHKSMEHARQRQGAFSSALPYEAGLPI
jgi:hypothetical protein